MMSNVYCTAVDLQLYVLPVEVLNLVVLVVVYPDRAQDPAVPSTVRLLNTPGRHPKTFGFDVGEGRF